MKRFLMLLILLFLACSHKPTSPNQGMLGRWDGAAWRYIHFPPDPDSFLVSPPGGLWDGLTIDISGSEIRAVIDGQTFFGSGLQSLSDPNLKFFLIWLPAPFNDTLFFSGKREGKTLSGNLWNNDLGSASGYITGFWSVHKK